MIPFVQPHLAVPQLDDVIRHAPDGFVVGDDDDRAPVSFVYIPDQLQDLLGGGVIQRPGRLVAEEDVGIFDDRPADGKRAAADRGKAGLRRLFRCS